MKVDVFWIITTKVNHFWIVGLKMVHFGDMSINYSEMVHSWEIRCYYSEKVHSVMVTFLKEGKFLTSGHGQAEKLVPHLASFDWQSMQEDSWDGLKIFTKTTSHMGLWLNV